jgi:hypothetical protein
LSTVAIAVGALIRGPAVVRSWLDRQAADADEARSGGGTIESARRRLSQSLQAQGRVAD